MDISTKNTILGAVLTSVMAMVLSGFGAWMVVQTNMAVQSEKITTLEVTTHESAEITKDLADKYHVLAANGAVRDSTLKVLIETSKELTESTKKLTSMVDRIDERMKMHESFTNEGSHRR